MPLPPKLGGPCPTPQTQNIPQQRNVRSPTDVTQFEALDQLQSVPYLDTLSATGKNSFDAGVWLGHLDANDTLASFKNPNILDEKAPLFVPINQDENITTVTNNDCAFLDDTIEDCAFLDDIIENACDDSPCKKRNEKSEFLVVTGKQHPKRKSEEKSSSDTNKKATIVRTVTITESETWSIQELEKLGQAIERTRNKKTTPTEKFREMASIVETRTFKEVKECYKEVHLHGGGIEAYIVHIHGRDGLANGVSRDKIGENDVIYCSGVSILKSHYEGLVKLRSYIIERLDNELLHELIAEQVVYKVLSNGGRFFEKVQKRGDQYPLYYPISHEMAKKLTIRRVKTVEKNETFKIDTLRHIDDVVNIVSCSPWGAATNA